MEGKLDLLMQMTRQLLEHEAETKARLGALEVAVAAWPQQAAAQAEKRAAAAEAALAEAKSEAAQREEECQSLRAALQQIRDAGRCPIFQGLWRDPVVASDGQTYDRRALEPWMHQHGTSPLNRQVLRVQVYPNRFAAAVVQHLGEVGMGNSDQGSIAGSDTAQSSGGSANAEEDAVATTQLSLLEAIRQREEALALLLLQRPRLFGLNHVDDSGSLLHYAVDAQSVAVALAILARPDFLMVNAKDEHGYSALHLAACFGFLPVCRAILGRADFVELRLCTPGRQRASQMARMQRNLAVAELLESAEEEAEDANDPDPWALQEAISRHDEAHALELLALPRLPGLNEVYDDQDTLLHLAIFEELPQAALALLARPDFLGVNATEGSGMTALHLAAFNGLLPVCEAIARRADFVALAALDPDGNTASSLARQRGHLAVAEFLESLAVTPS